MALVIRLLLIVRIPCWMQGVTNAPGLLQLACLRLSTSTHSMRQPVPTDNSIANPPLTTAPALVSQVYSLFRVQAVSCYHLVCPVLAVIVMFIREIGPQTSLLWSVLIR